MQKVYFFVKLVLCLCTIFPTLSNGQDCTTLGATFTAYESRCTATGSIIVTPYGGSGSYKYKTIGPVNSNFTSSDSLTGLSAGVYTVIINDLVTNCTFTQNNIVVPGTYQDPRFTLTGINVSCDNGSNGSITVLGQQFGRSPFAYSIVAPSPMGVGTTNNTGVFTNLIGGDYRIQMTDSCGGIQTRSITVDNYTWVIDLYSFNKISCDSASGFIRVIDSKGNVSTLGSIPGFMYGVVRSPGDTVWSSNPNFKLYVAGISSVDMIAKDGCGIIKKGTTSIKFTPSVGAVVNITNKACNTFSASLTSVTNFFGANYCLYDSLNVKVSCNSTGVFNNIPYGSYCIKAHELCLDTFITRCFTVSPPPVSVGKFVSVYNKNCTTFSVDIVGQSGLTNPTYCLFDSSGAKVSCNNTGKFNNLIYGSYCIATTDGCRDTTITRCFTILKPKPVVPVSIKPSYFDCKNITVQVIGDSLFFPKYCLYDSAGVLISCNKAGFFDSLSIGNYCVTIYDACYDTTIKRCFTVGEAVIANDLTLAISNKTCSTFTVKTTSKNLKSAQYCLYTQSDSLISCDTTGIFNNVAYGSYCVKAQNDCPDTLFKYCFIAAPSTPSVKNTVSISNIACSTFSATIKNQLNLTNPQFCIFDSNNVKIACNTTGIFDSLNYGDYCIKITNTCYDTTIIRCFSQLPKPIVVSVNSNKSCSYGYATFGISVTGGTLPINIKIYRPDNSLLFSNDYNTTNINIDSIPGTASGQTYKIVATDNCGSIDSVKTGVTASIVLHSPTVYAQCPSAAWLNGSGKLELTTTTNMGIFTVKIIKKNGVSLSPQLTPNTVSNGLYTFNNLGAGTYIVSYKLNDVCNRYLYDTVTVPPYAYPNLDRSSAYQCDINGFSVGAVASNGVGPFSYQIIGSSPAIPSITSLPQASPVFYINNGIKYSLIRLRALDACGNATLGDASILPLANYKINVDSNCFQSSSTLSVDTFYNSTYSWYKKANYNSVDSTYLGSGYNVYLPFLSASDTGTYICHISVNSGCVKRSFVYHLTGLCYVILPLKATAFSGKFLKEQVLLNWRSGQQETDLQNYSVERKNGSNTFTEIGRISPKPNSSSSPLYDFVDTKPETGNNFYRLRLLYNNNSFTYSNTIVLNKGKENKMIHCYPNPTANMLTIDFQSSGKHVFKIKLLNMVNQPVWETVFTSGITNSLQIHRSKSIAKGVYILKCIDINTNEESSVKVIFL